MFTLLIVTEGKLEFIQEFNSISQCREYLLFECTEYEKSNCYVEHITNQGEVMYVLIKVLPELYINVIPLDFILEDIKEWNYV